MYVTAHFDEEAKHKVEEMIELIMYELRATLRTEEWLSEQTKLVANEKISAIAQKIGFPSFLSNVTAVDHMYAKFATHHDSWFTSKMQFGRQMQTEVFERLGQQVDRTRWASGAAVVNAFYSPNTNEISECVPLR